LKSSGKSSNYGFKPLTWLLDSSLKVASPTQKHNNSSYQLPAIKGSQMQHKSLQHTLKSHFALDPRRLDFIAAFILALIKVRTVNLTQTGTALNGSVLPYEQDSTFLRRYSLRLFNLEDTHVTNLEQSEQLFALLIVALVWVVLTGEFVSSKKRLKLENHGSLERSIFRVGPDCLRQILLSGRSGKLVLDDVIPLLSSNQGSNGFQANRDGVHSRQQRSGMACARAFQVQGEVLGA
jgi:hypothetical protein